MTNIEELKKKFPIGTRVRVFGWVQMHHPPYVPRGGGVGHITYLDGNCAHVVFNDDPDEIHYVAHPKQCRILRPKKRQTYWAGGRYKGAPQFVLSQIKLLPDDIEVELREVRRK